MSQFSEGGPTKSEKPSAHAPLQKSMNTRGRRLTLTAYYGVELANAFTFDSKFT